MLAHRKPITLVLAAPIAVLISLTTCIASAQENEKRDATIGVLGYREGAWNLVDLSRRDPESNAPYLIVLICKTGLPGYEECPLKVGRTYKAKMTGAEGIILFSITINGAERGKFMSQTFRCDPRPSPEGGHWEWENGDARCKSGVKETVQWQPANARANSPGLEQYSACGSNCSHRVNECRGSCQQRGWPTGCTESCDAEDDSCGERCKQQYGSEGVQCHRRCVSQWSDAVHGGVCSKMTDYEARSACAKRAGETRDNCLSTCP